MEEPEEPLKHMTEQMDETAELIAHATAAINALSFFAYRNPGCFGGPLLVGGWQSCVRLPSNEWLCSKRSIGMPRSTKFHADYRKS
jgi:hypothetical protein